MNTQQVEQDIEEQESHAQEPAQKPVKQRKLWNLTRWINSPWVFAALPLIVGGVWLVQNLWIITNNLDKPYLLLAAPVTAATGIALWLIIKFFAAIANWTTALWTAIITARKADPIAWFFWLTIYILLGVSVIGSGAFFEEKFPHPIPGIGYGIAFTFDLVTVNAMRARLEAKRMRETGIAWLYLLAIVMCSSATIFGNVYVALDHAGTLPAWMVTVSPWLAFIFPTMIIIMSILADFLLEKTSTRLDIDTYRRREQDRLNLLIARREMREQMAEEEAKIAAIDARENDREFILKAWLFTQRKIDRVITILTATFEEMIAKKLEDLKQDFSSKQDLIQHQKVLQQTIEFQQKQVTELADLVAQLQAKIFQLQEDFSMRLEEFREEITTYLQEGMSDLENQLNETKKIVKNPSINERAPLEKLAHQERLILSYDPPKYGLQDDEIRLLITTFPALHAWLETGLVGVSEQEILEATTISSTKFKNALKGTTIKTAKGKGNKYQTWSVFRWLLREAKARSKQKKAPNSDIQTDPEITAVSANGNGNGHGKTELTDLVEMPV